MLNEIFKKFLESKKTNKKNILYIIKGGEFNNLDNFYSKVFNTTVIDIEKNNQNQLLNSILDLTNNNDTICLHYYEFCYIKKINLEGIFTAKGYKVIVIDFNVFNDYYVVSRKNETAQQMYSILDSDKECFMQEVYSNIGISDNYYIYSYNDNDISKNTISWKKDIFDTDIDRSTMRIKGVDYIPTSINDFDLIEKSLSYVNGKNTFYYSSVNTHKPNAFFNFNLQSLTQLGIKCVAVKPIESNDNHNTDEKYLDILQRLNSTAKFRELNIYKNPEYGDRDLTKISQSVIIHEIYNNAVNANYKKPYNDTFMIASTGAGKSIIFQIPAIKLAEELNLVTLVITPLIGLMNDQISNIRKLTNKAATINSEYTPIEKEKIKQQINDGEKSILYISPETLLSNTDIKTLIGDRKIGLLVIDEAHTVSTWGKSFRPDYWYLGDYLKKIKKYNSDMSFPTAAFTATATLGGVDDMYYDIIQDLSLNIKKPYIGKIVRDDIVFNINLVKKERDYRQEKDQLVAKRMNKFLTTNKKTLVYFPFVSQIKKTYKNILVNKINKVGKYYGRVDKLEKNETLEDFKTGKRKMVLATKAFGMGIDIDDIDNVYHYAPSGNLADYVQEIGRIARKKEMIGTAYTDYFEEDLRYIKQLHGLSSIKNYEVIGVVQKILQIYETKKTRNFLVSPEDFSHVFRESNDENIDNRLKTVLLVIRKDLESNLNLQKYALIFKPRSMFTKGLYMIFDEDIVFFEKIEWMKYLSKFRNKSQLSREDVNGDIVTYKGDVYEMDFKQLWSDKYKDLSFAQFKRAIFQGKIGDIYLGNKLKSKVWLEIKNNNNLTFKETVDVYSQFLEIIVKMLNTYNNSKKHFTMNMFSNKLYSDHGNIFKSKTQCELISNVVLYLMNNLRSSHHFNSSNFMNYNSNTEMYSIINNKYLGKRDVLIRTARRELRNSMGKKEELFLRNNAASGINKSSDKMRSDTLIVMAQIFELLGIAKYSIKSGDRPEFFMRVNGADVLERMATQEYKSVTVENINDLHNNSIRIMNHFFTKLTSDEERWDLIEKYFLGDEISTE
ncbi:DEAD/DEAH box helicase [Mycoplasmatota bacterium]|nr:DEAD/DEAH box helicase [Mycoplasmatota bacterium]